MPPMELDESDAFAPLDESLQSMPSDDEEQPCWKMRSIYRVPARITALNGEAYQPQVVSFGPYHHGEAHLLPMEEHKHRAVRHFLNRSKKPKERFFESLREVASDLEESYDALDLKWKAGSGKGAAPLFLELMITDGCFMLEILRFITNEVHDYVSNDPIFSNHGKVYMMPDILQDMLMLENQLPMLVLERLVAVESDGKKDDQFISTLILKFWHPSKAITMMGKCLHILDVFRNGLLMERKKDEEEVTFLDFTPSEDVIATQRDGSVNRLIINFCFQGIARMGLHVLDVFRKCMLMDPKKEDEVDWKKNPMIIQLASATELNEHGIRFKISETDSLKDISFADGVLTLPGIKVTAITVSRILNLMAFERLHVKAGIEVTSYIYCMGHIISNGRDVPLLRAQGIIANFLASDEAVAKMFNSLGNVAPGKFNRSLLDVLCKVNKYYNKRWNTWRANLIHAYFRNPWVTLSLIAAAFLFALTIIQTIYSVLSYYK